MSTKRILLFRSKLDDNTSNEDIYEKLLHDHGYHVKTISPIQFDFINQNLLLTKLKSNDYYALIFTSKRAVEAVQRVLSDDDRQRWQRIYVEGPATGTLVKEVFNSSTNVLGAECGGSEPLADLIIKDTSNVRDNQNTINLLFLCAQARLDMLPKKLSNEQNINLDELIVYETIPSKSLDKELKEYIQAYGKPDILGFFSPSGFDSVLKSNERTNFDLINDKTILISLGKTTSTAIRTHLDSKSIDERMCSKPTAEEFLRIVQNIN